MTLELNKAQLDIKVNLKCRGGSPTILSLESIFCATQCNIKYFLPSKL